jgi:hypothetical protein
VTITDAAGNSVFSEKTDGKGVAIATLIEQSVRNTKTEALSKQKLSPYFIQVESPGIGSAKRQIQALRTQEIELVLEAAR